MGTLPPGRPPPAPKPWYWRAWKNLQKRWVQVTLVILGGLLAAEVSWQILAPTVDAKADREATSTSFCIATTA